MIQRVTDMYGREAGRAGERDNSTTTKDTVTMANSVRGVGTEVAKQGRVKQGRVKQGRVKQGRVKQRNEYKYN